MVKKILVFLFLGLTLQFSDGYVEAADNLILNSIGPMDLVLGQNYPNPAKTRTTIEVNYPGHEAVIRIFDVLGKQVEEIFLTDKKVLVLDVSNYTDGIYLYTLEGGGEKITRRMTVKK